LPDRRSLIGELQRSHRAMVVALCVMLLLALVSSGYLILVSQPRLAAQIELGRQSRLAHEGMLDQETALRGWLPTGDERFLEPYAVGRQTSDDAADELVEMSSVTPEITDDILAMLLERQAWEVWAAQARRMQVTEVDRTSRELTNFLLEGKGLFDSYRSAYEVSTGLIIAERDRALAAQKVALIAVLVAYLVFLGTAAAIAIRRRRRLDSSVLQPVRQVLSTIDSLRSGDLSARSARTGLVELDAVGAALDAFAADLHQAEQLATTRENRLEQLAERLETVIRVARETSGSLSIRYVSETVASAAAELLGVPTTLWIRGEDGAFRAARRSQDPHGTVPSADIAARPLVAAVAADARASGDGEVSALPMVLAGTVVGVLEAAAPDIDEDTEHVLDALLSTGAAALESAHLHSSAREQAEVDALTGLPNRRRLATDLDVEWERCRRYGRPLSFAMVDLDHFKRLNDEFGHLVGDTVLRAVGVAVTDALRSIIAISALRMSARSLSPLR